MPPVERAAGRSAGETRTEIEAFLKHSRQPALLEPGEELMTGPHSLSSTHDPYIPEIPKRFPGHNAEFAARHSCLRLDN
jgi:hypothetical protein